MLKLCNCVIYEVLKHVPDLKKCEYVMLDTLSGKLNVILRVAYIIQLLTNEALDMM